MSKLGTSTYKETLKNYAYGVAQDVGSKLADFIAPRVPVGVGTGMFKKFDDKNAFQIYDTSRAVGGRANRINFLATDGTFNCSANALEIAIDDQEREKAGDADSALEEAKTRTLVISACLAREKRVMDLMAAASAGTTASCTISSDDPVAKIDEILEGIAIKTGMMPNRMVLGLSAWRKIKNSAKVLGRIQGVKAQGIGLGEFAGMLLNPQIDIRVAVLSKDAYKMGKTASKAEFVGDFGYIFDGNDNPTQYDPGFMKTFSIGSNSVEAVRMYREEGCRSDILAVDWSEDVQVVSTISLGKLTIS